MELDFGRRLKRGKCPVCKTKFKYKESADGVLTYIYKAKDLDKMERIREANYGTV